MVNKRLLCIIIALAVPYVALAAPKLDSNQPIDIAADTLEVRQQEKMAIFSGNVVATQGNITMKSGRMLVFYSAGDTPAAANNAATSISKIEADGGVFFTSPSETARSSKAVYEVSKEQIRMMGDVTLTRDSSVVKGAGLVYNLSTGRSVLTSGSTTNATTGETSGQRVRGLFVPGKEQ